MIWVVVFGGIALAGLVMVVAYAVWLVHKASDVFAELAVLARRGGQLAEITAGIELPEPGERRRSPLPARRPRKKRRR